MKMDFNEIDFSSWKHFFKRKESSSVGVDVGSDSIKIVELEKKSDRLVLKNYALVAVNKNLVRLGTNKHLINDISGELTRKVFEKLKIKNRKINLAIPGFASLITTVNLDAASVKEAQKILELEASKFIPLPLEEVVYDWQIIEEKSESKQEEKPENKKKDLSQNQQAKGKNQKAVIVAIMKEISQQYERIFETNGFEINTLEIDSFSLVRSLVDGNELDNYVILDIGGRVCNIIVTHQQNLIINKNVNVAGYRITDAISRSMGVESERAEKMKIQQGLNIEVKQLREQAIEPVLGIIVEELEKSLNVFKKNYPEERIKGVILSGGTSKMIGLVEYLKNKTGMEILIGNPWSRIDYPDGLKDKLTELAPSFAVATGLAMLGFDED
jgi:type IV pilus assembly protein PilM